MPLKLVLSLFVFGTVVWLASTRSVGYMGVGEALDPVDGLYASARAARPFDGTVDAPVGSRTTVAYDERGVPHIFSETPLDAVTALGYVVASDRLFQLEYLPRVAGGRLAEILGAEALAADRFLRSTGMLAGARRNLERIVADDGAEIALLRAFAAGANAFIEDISESELPVEYRILGTRPEPYTPLKSLLVAQFMNYDLSFQPPDDSFIGVVSRYGRAVYDSLYPEVLPFSVPIVPESVATVNRSTRDGTGPRSSGHTAGIRLPDTAFDQAPRAPANLPFDRFPGKGSNNWVISGAVSATGSPLLAGDMHLSLTLPAIWYEARLSAPGLNVYGVTIPGAPVIIAGFTDSLAWSLTNTASDQTDHYLLRTDSAGGRYVVDGTWLDFETVRDTFRVRGNDPVVDSNRISRFGPVAEQDGAVIALQWAGLKNNRILAALWGMNRATNEDAFEQAVRLWDSPMQNIAYADATGRTRIRSTGYLPVRRAGDGCGLLDGTTTEGDWIGRVPFEELPAVADPPAFASSTNQRPSSESYYVNCTWRSAFRSNRIDALLSSKASFDVADMTAYQSDVHSVAADYFVPLLSTLDLSDDAADQARALRRWDREMTIDATEPAVFAAWMAELSNYIWDEPGFAGSRPHESVLFEMIRDNPGSTWFDRIDTPQVEKAADALSASFESAVEAVSDHTWGEVHRLTIRHISRLGQLEPFWRGPYPFPGHDETLAPGAGTSVTSGASWRMIVDLSETPPSAWGIFPGGQSGNPLSEFYDATVDPYLRFAYFDLRMPADAKMAGDRRLVLLPLSQEREGLRRSNE